MKKELLFDFTVDEPAKTVFITREFDAALAVVWDAFTNHEILDQWNAPAPFVARTKYMNFEVGGKRLYAMVSPEGQERWILQEYKSITPLKSFKMFNVFASAEGVPELHGSEWEYQFSEAAGITTVKITIFNESYERMKNMLEWGFKPGFTQTLLNLEAVLAVLDTK